MPCYVATQQSLSNRHMLNDGNDVKIKETNYLSASNTQILHKSDKLLQRNTDSVQHSNQIEGMNAVADGV